MFELSEETKMEIFRNFMGVSTDFGYSIVTVIDGLKEIIQSYDEGVIQFGEENAPPEGHPLHTLRLIMETMKDVLFESLTEWTKTFHNTNVTLGFVTREEMVANAAESGLSTEAISDLIDYLDGIERPQED